MSVSKKEKIALALGFFDGVHQGHGALLQKVAEHSATAAVLTFDRHPGTLLGTKTSELLSTVEDRCWLIEKIQHISQVIVADFAAIHQMDWKDFITEYLQKELHVTHVVAGHDFRFGKGGAGTAERLEEYCNKNGMTCEIIPAVTLEKILVSSTYIRQLIQTGEMERATQFLGHPHILSNRVEHGNKIGSMVLGFPTVNLSIPDGVIIPFFGVYACRIWIGDLVFNGVANVGIRPTVEEQDKKVTVEGFILDYPGEELYGQNLRIGFYHHIRGERKFDDFSALTAQIAKDVEATRLFFQQKQWLPF